MKQFLVIEGSQPSGMDRAIVRLADWMGVETKVITNVRHSDVMDQLECAARYGQVCVAAGADTLAQRPELSKIILATLGGDAKRSVPMLVYGITGSSSHTALLENLGCRWIHRVHQIKKQPLRYRFSANEKACLQQLAGMEFSDESSVACDVFEIASLVTDDVVSLLFAEDCPVLVRAQAGRGDIDLYLWATDQIADVEAPVSRGVEVESLYQWLLPAIVYLKACFGSQCWHNPNVRARLIIDDPLLHPQYGFLRYDALLESMRRVPYGTSLAFIPWNYRRTHKQVADMFLENSGVLSLCVHGCDHTNHEFDSYDVRQLIQISSMALQRMMEHHARSSVPHEKVMVFPQGHFSSIALRALRISGFVAAVNSSCYPSREEVTFRLGDLMRPAVCHFYGFPIFLRRGPIRIFDIAVDLFVGRAGFIVEHHEFVRDGYGKWEQFVAAMNGLDERLTWAGLEETITESCLQKVAGDNRMDVQFFTHIFRWRNRTSHAVHVHLGKSEPDPLIVNQLLINGAPHPYVLKDGWLYCDFLVKPDAAIHVTILYEDSTKLVPFRPSLGHALGVSIRRVLSELRDNHLSRHPKLLGYAKAAVRHLGLTSDSHHGS